MLNDLFATMLDDAGIQYQREYKAIPGRKFSFDFFVWKEWSDKHLLIELQGGIYMKHGGHNSPSGIQRDCEKLNLAVLNGFDVMHFTTDDVEDGTALQTVKQYLKMEEK